MKTEVLSFRKDIAPNTSLTLKERVKADGSVSKIFVRFYPGVEKSLQVRPYILHKGNRAEDVITYVEGTDNYLSGDSDSFEYPVTVDVKYDDEIVVYVNNTDLANTYSLVVDVKVDFHSFEVNEL